MEHIDDENNINYNSNKKNNIPTPKQNPYAASGRHGKLVNSSATETSDILSKTYTTNKGANNSMVFDKSLLAAVESNDDINILNELKRGRRPEVNI